ncbi:MAG: 50S ribosomal protein L17 [Candidatus Pacebacteria bacterium]|nr:50S ribosomal protein L17 [Candidatus Paceibacterota bacterium]
MWKRKKGRKFSRKRDQRKALLKSMARSLFLKEKIKITQAKAKDLRSFAEKIITRAKKKDLSSKRYLAGYFSKEVVKKITDEIAPRYQDRKGGYTKIIKLEPRKSDGAKMAEIELIK